MAKDKEARTISLPTPMRERLDARNSTRSTQVVEELTFLYTLYEEADICTKFTDDELELMTSKLLGIDFEEVSKKIDTPTLITNLFDTESKENGVSVRLAAKVKGLSNLQLFALIDELRRRYKASKAALRERMLKTVAGDQKKRRRRA